MDSRLNKQHAIEQIRTVLADSNIESIILLTCDSKGNMSCIQHTTSLAELAVLTGLLSATTNDRYNQVLKRS